jgi:glutathione S-transferase
MKLTLHHAPRACSMVTLMTLYEAGVPFDVQPVNTRRQGTRSADYLALNPKGKVPVLVIDGRPLTENIAILTWIARAVPEKRLMPADPEGWIEALSLMAWCGSTLHPILPRMNFPQQYCDAPGTEQAVHRLAMADLVRQMAVAEQRLAGREWLFDHFTLCDLYLWWVWYRAVIPKPCMETGPFPNLSAYAARVEQRPSVQKALAYADELEASFASA